MLWASQNRRCFFVSSHSASRPTTIVWVAIAYRNQGPARSHCCPLRWLGRTMSLHSQEATKAIQVPQGKIMRNLKAEHSEADQ